MTRTCELCNALDGKPLDEGGLRPALGVDGEHLQHEVESRLQAVDTEAREAGGGVEAQPALRHFDHLHHEVLRQATVEALHAVHRQRLGGLVRDAAVGQGKRPTFAHTKAIGMR